MWVRQQNTSANEISKCSSEKELTHLKYRSKWQLEAGQRQIPWPLLQLEEAIINFLWPLLCLHC
jgi:hypothetical protein